MKKKNKLNVDNNVDKLPVEKLDAALLDVYDLMWRNLLQLNFITLGDTAKCIRERRALEGNKIEVGIEKRYVSKEVITTIKEWKPDAKFDKKGISYTYNGVPIFIKYITRNYYWFQDLDTAWYGPEVYKLPNPFDKYYKARFIIH